MSTPDPLARARAARADDPDPDTRAELDALLAQAGRDAAVDAELRERFGSRIAFGTAGLRGLLGAGDNRMNMRIVAQTTAALCAALQRHVPSAQQRGLCIGFDGRHKSAAFAREAQAIANGAGFLVHAFEAPLPTPLLAYAVLQRAAAGGIMITASHNPAAYNGYKVYWENGAQLSAPYDAEIARDLATDPSALALPRVTLAAARAAGLWRSLAGLEGDYLRALAARLGPAPSPRKPPRVAYTALHGVGETLARAALREAGVTDLESVRAQAEPDPDFPSVRFPNPEEPGATDQVLALAERTAADLALANDPDADRLAAGARTDAGACATLSGNELGLLLCDYLLQRAPRDGRNLIVTTLVSTPLAAAVAHAHGARLEVTLTGFKWILGRALALERQGLRFVLGFEEAIGYCIGDLVRDKDGIAAAAHVARMSEWYAANGLGSLHGALEALYRTHGLAHSVQLSLSVPPSAAALEQLRRRLAQLRTQPITQLAGLTVSARRDLLEAHARAQPDWPATDLLCFELEGVHRVTLRPSGTEPKIKVYIDCAAPLGPSESLAQAREPLQQLCRRIADDLRERLEHRTH